MDHHRIIAPLAGELLIEVQGLLEELPLYWLHLWLLGQPLQGDLRVHLIDGTTGPVALRKRLGLSSPGEDGLPEAQGYAHDQRQGHYDRRRQRRPVASDK